VEESCRAAFSDRVGESDRVKEYEKRNLANGKKKRVLLWCTSRTLNAQRGLRLANKPSHNLRQVTICDIAATSATASVPLVVFQGASGRILRPRRHEATWTRDRVPARREGACLVSSEFKPHAFLRVTDSTSAEAAARRATAALATAAGDAPAHGDA